MIWFFLGGMIAGSVGTFMLAGWWARKRGLNETGHKDKNSTDCRG